MPKTLKEFHLKADCTFYAEDIDDAFMRLSKHFEYLTTTEDAHLETITNGLINIEPTGKELNYE